MTETNEAESAKTKMVDDLIALIIRMGESTDPALKQEEIASFVAMLPGMLDVVLLTPMRAREAREAELHAAQIKHFRTVERCVAHLGTLAKMQAVVLDEDRALTAKAEDMLGIKPRAARRGAKRKPGKKKPRATR